ncbi:Uncharacterised protein [Mycobacteroides abscessus subsp. abscessus]|nr:Uncharacterised protein [Mycobacteroides abscessus subsp. abscessus]
MGVTAEVIVLEQRSDVEAEDQLSDAVTLILGKCLHVGERLAIKEFRHQNLRRAQFGDTVGNDDEGVPTVALGDLVLGARFPGIVEFAFQVHGYLVHECRIG